MWLIALFEVFDCISGVVGVNVVVDDLIEGNIESETGIVIVDGNVLRTIGSALSSISSMHCETIDVLLLLLLIEPPRLLLIFELIKVLDTPSALFESFNKHSEKLPTVISQSFLCTEYNKIMYIR